MSTEFWKFFSDDKVIDDDISSWLQDKISKQLDNWLVDDKFGILVRVESGGKMKYLSFSNPNSSRNYMREILLLDSVDENNTKLAEFLLNSGSKDDNAYILSNCEFLHKAACFGNVPMTRLLLDVGTPLDTVDEFNKTALHHAVQMKRYEIARMLIDQGILQNLDNHKRPCLLCIAIESDYGDDEFAFLLNAVINSNITALEATDCTSGLTCLQAAAKFRRKNLLIKLLQMGANINAPSTEGVTAIYYAAANESQLIANHLESEANSQILKLLITNHAEVNSRPLNGLTAFDHVLRAGRKETLLLFVENGVSLEKYESHDPEYPSPLFHAIINKDSRVFKFIVDSNEFDIHEKNSKGENILHCATKLGDIKILKYLTEKRVDVNCTNKNGLTPLCFATASCKLEYIEQMILNGAQVDDQCLKYALVFLRRNSPQRHDILRCIVRYLVIAELQGKSPEDRNINTIRYSSFLQRVYKNCKDELKSMQTTFIHDDISFYEVLTNTKLYAKDLNVIVGLGSEEDVKVFENYGEILLKHFRKEREAFSLLNEIETKAEKIAKCKARMPKKTPQKTREALREGYLRRFILV